MKLFSTKSIMLLVFVLQTFYSNSIQAQTIYFIKPIATGIEDGSSWANASNNIQTIIQNSVSGDMIWVAAGVYMPVGNYFSDRYGTFNLKNNVAIYGGFSGNETSLSQRNWKANITVLSGDFLNDDIVTASGSLTFLNNNENCFHVLRATNINNTAILDGFTIKGGNANGGDGGGGMYNSNGSPTINNLIFINNSGSYGGGMYNESSSSPILNNIVFHRNAGFNAGGGLYNISSSPNIINSIFSENIVRGANSTGGGMYNISSSPIITNTNFVSNNSLDVGGGLCNAFSSPIIKNCIFWGNVGLGASTQQIQSGGGNPSITYTIVEGSSVYPGTGNNNANPLFLNVSDLDGIDNIWLTSDDGLRIPCTSPANNAGTSIFPILDILGNTRKGTIDIGSYETNNGTTASNSLPINYTSVYINQVSAIVNYSDCINQIIKIDGTAPNTILGNVEAKVWIDAVQSSQFVKRHYEIKPSTNPTSATAKVTLYFTDADFNAFNTQATPPTLLLPISTDAPATITTRKTNLRVEKRAGTGDANGTLNSYTGNPTTIDPADADIIWNAIASRWEVSFNVTGFSGFWVKTIIDVLPLTLLNFSGKKTNSGNLLQWKTSSEINTKSFEIERQIEIPGGQWSLLFTQNAVGNASNNYSYTDVVKVNETALYRLKIIDGDDKFTYTHIIRLAHQFNKQSIVFPNPITTTARLEIRDKKLLNTLVNVMDANGKIIKTILIKNNVEIIDLASMPNGLYLLKMANGETQKMIKY